MEFFILFAFAAIVAASSMIWYRIGYDKGLDDASDIIDETVAQIRATYDDSDDETEDEFSNFVEINNGKFVTLSQDDNDSLPDVAIRDDQNYKG